MPILVNRNDFARVAWSAPMRDLADRVGMSNVGLRKIFVKLGLSIPPQGYWNKVRAGRQVPRGPRAVARRPGCHDQMLVDDWLGAVLEPVAPRTSEGPFASPHVPEDLEELRALVRTAIGEPVSVLAAAERLHPAIERLLVHDGALTENPTPGRKELPAFTTPLSLRQLALMSAVFQTLRRAGHNCFASVDADVLRAGAVIGETTVILDTGVIGRTAPARTNLLSRYREVGPASALAFSTCAGEIWADGAAGRLEDKIADIAAGLIVAGEVLYRSSFDRMREEEEQARLRAREREREYQRQQAIVAWGSAERKRATVLRELGDIRYQLERAEEAARIAGIQLNDADAVIWRQWSAQVATVTDLSSFERTVGTRSPVCEGERWP